MEATFGMMRRRRCRQEVRRGLRHDRRRAGRTPHADQEVRHHRQRAYAAGRLGGRRRVHPRVMESAGNYCKPVLNMLEAHVCVILANAADAQNSRSHNADTNYSRWLAHLLRHGMIRPSFIAHLAIRELRDLTRRHRQLIRENSWERKLV
jgi:hypothetical protein